MEVSLVQLKSKWAVYGLWNEKFEWVWYLGFNPVAKWIASMQCAWFQFMRSKYYPLGNKESHISALKWMRDWFLFPQNNSFQCFKQFWQGMSLQRGGFSIVFFFFPCRHTTFVPKQRWKILFLTSNCKTREPGSLYIWLSPDAETQKGNCACLTTALFMLVRNTFSHKASSPAGSRMQLLLI